MAISFFASSHHPVVALVLLGRLYKITHKMQHLHFATACQHCYQCSNNCGYSDVTLTAFLLEINII